MDTSVTSSAGGANVVKVESRIGFLGGGQMALALGKGFMQSGLVAPSQVHYSIAASEISSTLDITWPYRAFNNLTVLDVG